MNKFNPDIHHRCSIRLKDYDYSKAGAYFVTVCVNDRMCVFGDIEGGCVRLSDIGTIARESWIKMPENFEDICLDEFVIMPNHMHGIIIFTDNRRGLINQTLTNQTLTNQTLTNQTLTNQTPTRGIDSWILMRNPKQTLGKVIRHFKARTTKMIHDNGYLEFQWQRNYYERVIRNDEELNRTREYIMYNPARWAEDEENPVNI